MRLMASVAVCAVFVTAVASAGTSADCGAPAAMSDGWPVSPPAQQGLDPQLICSTGSGLAKLTEADPHGVVVIRHGVLVYEHYLAGDDLRGWTPVGVVPHDANTLHNIQFDILEPTTVEGDTDQQRDDALGDGDVTATDRLGWQPRLGRAVPLRGARV